MQSLREFFTSSSGLVPARQGLALGWVISALTGITVLLGAKETEAQVECDGTPSWTVREGSSGCEAIPGDADCKCKECWLDASCNVRCAGWYCCTC